MTNNKMPVVTKRVDFDGVYIRAEIARRFDEGPFCPFCRDKLVRIHMELEDGSGWLHGWTCNCAQNEAQPT